MLRTPQDLGGITGLIRCGNCERVCRSAVSAVFMTLVGRCLCSVLSYTGIHVLYAHSQGGGAFLLGGDLRDVT